MKERKFQYYGSEYTIYKNGEEADCNYTIIRKRHLKRGDKIVECVQRLDTDRHEYWEFATKECVERAYNCTDPKKLKAILSAHREAQMHLRLLFAMRRPKEAISESK